MHKKNGFVPKPEKQPGEPEETDAGWELQEQQLGVKKEGEEIS